MNGKTFFIDQSRCTACRGCQIACKQWKKLPGDHTVNTGSYQNPPQVNEHTLKLVHFSEVEVDGEFKWLFFPEQCRHCITPPCKLAGDMYVPGAIEQDQETGAILYSERTKDLPYQIVREACPFDIPRQDPKSGVLVKCNMCIDRVRNGMEPACVKTCPTGAIQFGTKEAMKEQAAHRVVDLKDRGYDKAGLYDPQGVGGTHVMYVLHHADKPSLYKGLPDDPSISPMVSLWKGVAKPLALAALGAAAVGSFFHYITKGPLEVPEELEAEEARKAEQSKENRS